MTTSLSLALDPLTPERPLDVAKQFVRLIHETAERHAEPLAERAKAELDALDLIATKTLADVRYDAERLLYLAERAALDGFPVHDQLIAVAEAHEQEIKRLGSQVIAQYKALVAKLHVAPRVQSYLKRVFAAAEAFQESWLAIARQMRHRGQTIGRREVARGRIVIAAELYLEGLAQAFGDVDAIELKPTVAGDMLVYELVIPVEPALCDDPGALLAREDAVHAAIERAAPWLVGALALRYRPSGATP
jgi:uncharacterized membrane protein YkoI